MDGAISGRKFPSYTTSQLEAFVAEGRGSEAIIQEIADRKSGVSVVRSAPQIIGGQVMVKVGRI